MLFPLSKMKIGQTAEISWLADHKAITKRLLDLGFEPGTRVGCVLTRRGGGISAYWVKGAVIALRREDAELILVNEEGCKKEENGQ
jgi:ferrous iron transport protein A